MTPVWNRAVGLLFWTAAFAWPFDLLQYVPGLGVSLLALVALLLVPPLLLDAMAQQKLRVPFEILAPSVAILAVVGIDAALHGPGETVGEIVAGIVLLVALIHFAPPRESIRRYVLASVLAGFAVTLWTLFSRLIDVTPTAFSTRSGVTFTFAYTVPTAVHILFLLLAASLYVARERWFQPPARAAATGAIPFILCALIGAAVFWTLDTRALPVASYPSLAPLEVAAAILALWLLARIAAKIVVAARAQRDPLHAFWLTVAAVSVLVCACAPVPPGAYQGLLAGLAVATVSPVRLLARPGRARYALAAIPVLLAAINMTAVFPGNPRDQRQYDAASRRDFDAGDYTRLLARLDTIERHAPAERRTHLWRARTALALGLPNWASFEYARAVAPPNGTLLLGAPTVAERKDFVVQMRDVVAALPEDRSACAFERTLLAEGERDSALYSLRLETAVPLTHIESADPAPFVGALVSIAGDPALADDLADWSAEELVTLLTYWGASLGESTASTDAAVLVAQRTPGGLAIYTHIDGRASDLQVDLPPPTPGEVAALVAAGLPRWEPDAETSGFVLFVDSGTGPREIGRLYFGRNAVPRFDLADAPPVIPFTPAIYLRLGG